MANNGMIQSANTALQNKRKPKSIQDYIQDMGPGIKAALPSVMTPERFTRIALSAVSGNKKLQECEPASFLGAMMTAAQLGLEPNTPLGQAYLIPYGKKCQFQLGYKGLIDLAWRSGEVLDIQAEAVRENDFFEYELGLDPKLKHVPAEGDRGDPKRYYAVIRTKSGGSIYTVMSIEEIRAHAKRFSQSYSSGPWQTNFDEMAKKTVLKRALKYAPLKSEFVRAVSSDETIKDTLAEDMADMPDITEYVEVDENTGEVIENA